MVEFYFFLVTFPILNLRQIGSRMPKGINIEQERERYMKMSPLLLFDYMKGFYFKINNENENLKIQLQKAIDGDPLKEYMNANNKEADTYYAELRKQNEKVMFDNSRLRGELDKTMSLLNDVK